MLSFVLERCSVQVMLESGGAWSQTTESNHYYVDTVILVGGTLVYIHEF